MDTLSSPWLYVPTFQGLTPIDFVRRRAAPAHPFSAPAAIPFHRARNAIYQLFRALQSSRRRAIDVLMPDYNSGNEVAAVAAAGARIRYYGIDRRMQIDAEQLLHACEARPPDVLYVIHYLGAPQAMGELVTACRAAGTLVVEDCALALLSGAGGDPIGTCGDWAVYCLYKTLPVPDGALLVCNRGSLPTIGGSIGPASGVAGVESPATSASWMSSAGRTAELLLQRLRSRAGRSGALLMHGKGLLGRLAVRLEPNRDRVGDIRFDLEGIDLEMSGITRWIVPRCRLDTIRRRRVAHYRWLARALEGHVTPVWDDLPAGACPLVFPILVADKPAVARRLERDGVRALEFWNEGWPECDRQQSPTASYLRRHVLGLPVHQDLRARHLVRIADAVKRADLQPPPV